MDKHRYILLHGKKIYVSEEIYREYYRPVWRESKQHKIRLKMECSLDALLDSGIETNSGDAPMDEIITDKLLLDKLQTVLVELTHDERNLLHEIFSHGKSERELSKTLGISSIAVHKRKHKALSKLHRLLKS